MSSTHMISADEALERLKQGNQHFVAERQLSSESITQARQEELASGQNPFAIVLSCSDSRVPPEIIFNQGLGDLFIIRVAGNIVAPSLIGSVEFAAQQFGTRLVVVLGHSQCGAIKATLQSIETGQASDSPNLNAIIDSIKPAIETVASETDDTLEKAIKANVAASAAQLSENSPALQDLIQNDGLKIVGAEYALETGKVEFL